MEGVVGKEKKWQWPCLCEERYPGTQGPVQLEKVWPKILHVHSKELQVMGRARELLKSGCPSLLIL